MLVSSISRPLSEHNNVNAITWTPLLIAGVIGFIIGLAVACPFWMLRAKTARELADELFRESEEKRRADREDLIESIKANFGRLSLEALSTSTEEFLKLSKTVLQSEREVSVKELEAKKLLIDQQLQRMHKEMESVASLVRELERDRLEKYGDLSSQLRAAGEQTAALTQITNSLREALSNTKARGQWGERMAEDILRISGLVENVNYLRQKVIDGPGTRPDFTFLLPHDLKLNMDVKFPLDNYSKFLAAEAEVDRDKYRTMFLRDVRARIKEVTSREYINLEQKTVDCVLLFIPNEHVYAFIHEHDGSLFEHAIKNRVVFCSPVTLFAVIAVIRQATENFALTQTSHQILSLFGRFKQQWTEYLKRLEVLGRRLSDAQREFEALTTIRKRMLEKPLNDIESLRIERGLSVAADDSEEGCGIKIEHDLKSS